MKNKGIIISLILGVLITIVCCVIGFFVLAIVLPISKDKKDNYEQEVCIVKVQHIVNKICYENCNCHQSCTGTTKQRSCHQVCDSCPYFCYDGSVTYTLNVTFGDYEITRIICSNYRSSAQVQNDLNSCCPVNSQKICYYDKRNPAEITFVKPQPKVWFSLSFIFFTLACFPCFCTLLLSFFLLVKKRETSYIDEIVLRE